LALQAIEPRRLYRQVADQLRSYLDSGAIPIGARMPTERELAEQLNVSRPTIREALIALEVEGRIRIRVGSGIYVSEPPVANGIAPEHEGPFELIRARMFIEGAIMAEAALLVEPEHLAILDEILEHMAVKTSDHDEMTRLDRAFHVAIAAVLGNSVVTRMVREMFDQRMSPYFGRLAVHFENDATWQQTVNEHLAIRNALAAHDPVMARETLRVHLGSSQERYSRSFGEAEGENDDRQPLEIKRMAGRS
jgi:DNA-binding FadR family transcriptional regulator